MEAPTESTKERYEIILDSIADGVFTVNLDMRITSFNKAAEKITGVRKIEAIGRPCFEVLRANTCEKECLLGRTIKTGRPVVNMPIHIISADKRRIPISINTSLLENSAGEVIGGVETFRDLTVVNKLRRALLKQHSFEDIVSKDKRMLEILSVLPLIAESDSTVIIEGASGTGKELIARAIHDSSARKEGPFVAVNCGALPDSLCDSELFGYKAGAFTDAKKDKPGRFSLAQNGTILLDEIGDVSKATQIRLLRVLEEKLYEPLGSIEKTGTNARVVTATHRDLEKLVQEGEFREDLYFRINVIRISLPTLSERKDDIPLLVDKFVENLNQLKGKQILGITQEAMAALMLHDWPGNVRELENAIEHAFVLCQGDLIRLENLPDRFYTAKDLIPLPDGLTLKQIEKRAIEQALKRNDWRKVATAKELGIDKNSLRRKIKRLGIESPLP